MFASDFRNGVKTSRITNVKKGAIINKVIINTIKESKLGINSKIKRVLFCMNFLSAGLSNLSIILKTDSENNWMRIIAKKSDSEGTALRKVSLIIAVKAILPHFKVNCSGRDLNPSYRLEKPGCLTWLHYRSLRIRLEGLFIKLLGERYINDLKDLKVEVIN